MTYVVTDSCIRCKYMDCVPVCPVDCFYEGDTMLVIDPDHCIDCGVCESECPVQAIVPDTHPDAADWIELNRQYSLLWPNITQKGVVPFDADTWATITSKRAYLTPDSKTCHSTSDFKIRE